MIETVKNNVYKKESIELNLVEPKIKQIKTIVFDFGGVIFTDGSWMARKKIRNAFRLKDEDVELLKECFTNEPGDMGQLIRLGLISLDEFLDKFITKLNLPKSKKKLIKHLWNSSYVLNYKMRKVLKRLSKKYRLVAFSGNVRERIEYLEKRYNILKYFDDMVFTFDYQKNKRDLELYRELLEHIDCEPSEAVLIDDSWNNVYRAEEVGMKGVVFSYTKKLLRDLEKIDIKIKI